MAKSSKALERECADHARKCKQCNSRIKCNRWHRLSDAAYFARQSEKGR